MRYIIGFKIKFNYRILLFGRVTNLYKHNMSHHVYLNILNLLFSSTQNSKIKLL